MQRKRLEDMNLLDDFLFNAVMTFPGIGERFCRLLLQVVLVFVLFIMFFVAGLDALFGWLLLKVLG